ncbi:MAG: hypothetical protein ACSHX3_00115 [Litorimonas sp.]
MTSDLLKPRFLLDFSRLAVVDLNPGRKRHSDLLALEEDLKVFDIDDGVSPLIQRLLDLETIDQILVVGGQAYIEVAFTGFALLEAGFDVSVMVEADRRQDWSASKISASGMLLMTEAECVAELGANSS